MDDTLHEIGSRICDTTTGFIGAIMGILHEKRGVSYSVKNAKGDHSWIEHEDAVSATASDAGQDAEQPSA